LFQPDIS